MGKIVVKNPKTGKMVEIRDTALVQEVSKLNTSFEVLKQSTKNLETDTTMLKTSVSSLQSQVNLALVTLNEINGEEV